MNPARVFFEALTCHPVNGPSGLCMETHPQVARRLSHLFFLQRFKKLVCVLLTFCFFRRRAYPSFTPSSPTTLLNISLFFGRTRLHGGCPPSSRNSPPLLFLLVQFFPSVLSERVFYHFGYLLPRILSCFTCPSISP